MNLECQHCSYNPLSVIASHTFLTLNELELLLNIKSIAFQVGISKNSIYSFIDPNKHRCVKPGIMYTNTFYVGKKYQRGKGIGGFSAQF